MTSRRAFLGVIAGLTAACTTESTPLPPPTVTDSQPNRPVNVERVRSAARGTDVRLVVIRPDGHLDAELPDGGDSYWVARDPADDPQRMLTDELPGWLAERGLATTPFAAFGISMGAYGALNYARNPHHPAVAAISRHCS